MNIYIRTDASLQIGSGHVMRCLTLAKELQKVGMKVTFICRKLEGNLISLILNGNFDVKELPKIENANDFEWIETHWRQDAEETLSVIQEKVNLLILDHYALDEKWEEMLKKYVRFLMVIDDFADKVHNCDLLLNTTYEINKKNYKNLLINNSTQLLLGSNYTLLRQEFINNYSFKYRMNPDHDIVHLFFGSMDKDNYTYRFGKLLLDSFEKIKIIAVVGEHYQYYEDLLYLAETNQNRLLLFKNVSNMAELMKKCNIAIGAPGTATWERACLGLPAVYLAVSPNQISILKKLNSYNMCVFIGEANHLRDEEFISKIDKILKDRILLKKLSVNSKKMIDGKGSSRVVSSIITLLKKGD